MSHLVRQVKEENQSLNVRVKVIEVIEKMNYLGSGGDGNMDSTCPRNASIA